MPDLPGCANAFFWQHDPRNVRENQRDGATLLMARHPAATAINVVLDNARYDHFKAIKAFLAQPDCRIKLLYPPFYAPDLNLIERLWQLMKKKTLWNCFYPELAEFKAVLTGCFDDIVDYRDDIVSLITDEFDSASESKLQVS